MSFSFDITGTRQGVMRELAKVADGYENALRDETMSYAMSQVAQFPDDFKFLISVKANGHHDSTSRNVNVSIQPVYTKIALEGEWCGIHDMPIIDGRCVRDGAGKESGE